MKSHILQDNVKKIKKVCHGIKATLKKNQQDNINEFI